MQVVLPSVSRADVVQGTALTVSVETPSSAVLDRPTVVPGFCGLPTTGADPVVIGTFDGGGEAAGGDAMASPVVVVVGVCAHADDDSMTTVAAIMMLRIMRLLGPKKRDGPLACGLAYQHSAVSTAGRITPPRPQERGRNAPVALWMPARNSTRRACSSGPDSPPRVRFRLRRCRPCAGSGPFQH